jgi:hypothetical protein
MQVNARSKHRSNLEPPEPGSKRQFHPPPGLPKRAGKLIERVSTYTYPGRQAEPQGQIPRDNEIVGAKRKAPKLKILLDKALVKR